MWIPQARTLEQGCHALLQGIFPTWDRTQVPHIAGGLLLSEPQGRPKDTEVGSLSLLQGIFHGYAVLLHCREILTS